MPMSPRLLRPIASSTWTPAVLGTQVAAWFDADNAASITLNGSSVSRWNDRSGNGRHVSQSSASAQPLYETNQLNGKPVLTFDITDDRMFTTAGGASGVVDASFFVVMRFASGGNNEDSPVGIGQSGQVRQVRTLYRTSNGTTLGFSGWANDISASAYSCDIGGSYHIFAARQTGRTVQMRRDGLGANYTAGSDFSAVNSNNLFIGGIDTVSDGGNRRTDGSFAEVIVFYNYASDTITSLVERYLSRKWGISIA